MFPAALELINIFFFLAFHGTLIFLGMKNMMCFKRKLEKSRVNVDTNSLVVFFYILKFIPQI